MATPASRIQGWIESLSAAWGKTLGAWCAGFVAGGIEGILDILGKKQAIQLKPLLDKLESAGGIPPELAPIINEVKTPTGESAFGFGLGIFNKLAGSIKGDVFEYVTRSITRAFSYSADFYLPDAKLLIDYYFKRYITREELNERMRDHGIPPDAVDDLLIATKTLFPSAIVAEAWLRDKSKYAQYWSDVYTLMGLNPELRQDQQRIELLQELAYRMPSAQEAITWLAREVFEPQMVAKYGLDEEFGGINRELLDQIGIKPEHQVNYWRAHWEHASYSQVVNMLHRGVLGTNGTYGSPPASATERRQRDAEGYDEFYNWFRLVEIPPYWRDGLISTAWNVPGRIEARMLAQYGLVDKKFLVELLARDGLAEEYRSIVADMMLVRGIRTDIQTRYTKKWINAAEVRGEIDAAGLDPVVADKLYKWIVVNSATERTAPERDLTAAEVLKGYKKRFTTYDETVAGLVALGYDEAEAAYKIAIDTTVTTEPAAPDLTVRIDTIRRQRRQRILTRDQEISELLRLNISSDVADAYADNDDLRLVKISAAKAPEVLPEYQTDAGKVNVETIRLSRRQRQVSRLEEITALLDLEMSQELAVAYADNDDLRLVKIPIGGA